MPHPFVRSLIRSTTGIWKQYVEHDFVKLLGRGTLPREAFVHFIKYVLANISPMGPMST